MKRDIAWHKGLIEELREALKNCIRQRPGDIREAILIYNKYRCSDECKDHTEQFMVWFDNASDKEMEQLK